MTMEDINAFLAVYSNKTIMRASESLYVSASTLSWRMKRLEDELGFELFTRHKGVKQIELTESGVVFLPYAEMIARLWLEATEALGSGEKRFNIVIANGHNLLFESIYSEFTEKHPNIPLHISLRHMADAYALVGAGKAVVGFTATTQDSDKIKSFPLCDEPEVLVCGTNSPIAAKNVVSLKDLRVDDGIRWWLDGASIGQWFDRLFPEGQFKRIVQDDNNLLMSALNNSRYWSIIPASSAAVFAERRRGILVKNVDFECPTRHMYLIMKSGHTPSKLVWEILSIIKTDFVNRGMLWLYNK